LIKVQKHKIDIKHTSSSCLTIKKQYEEGQTKIELENEQQSQGFIQFFSRNQYIQSVLHGIQIKTQLNYFKKKKT